MNLLYFTQSNKNQYFISVIVVIAVSSICFLITDFIGYRTVALLLLTSVSLLAIFFSLYPILVAAALSALVWDFFFIPPRFTLHVNKTEDALMLVMYFIIAFINGVMTSKLRQFEKIAFIKEERQNTIKLYKTLFDSISHELRTPIATIVGATDNLLSQNTPQLTEKNKHKLISEISIAAFRLNRLFDNLLNMQRLESGFLKPKFDWCDLNELIANVLNHLKPDLESHNVKIEMDKDFPLVKLDAGLIEQAIYNIVYNATVYTQKDSEISIEAILENQTLIIVISDTGKGFEPGQLTEVFKKYYYSNKVRKGGIGLGLSISKGFIDAHNGRIVVENNSTGGAKFTISIPVETFTMNESFDLSEQSQ